MCRFFGCELSKNQLTKKCIYKKNNIKYEVPWTDSETGIEYNPSNLLQIKSSGLPVIIDGKHLQSSENQIFCPMYWTLIPSWYKGNNVNEWNASTHNARLDNLLQSNIYSSSLNEGKRCLIIMEGFYEHKKGGSQNTEVYYLQSPQNNLLKAAGLFSTLKKQNGDTLFTCTMITTESVGNVRQVHQRSPLLLHDDVDIEAWLDFKSISSTDAVSKIKAIPQTDLKLHQTEKVGSKESKTAKKVLASKTVMSNWLQSSSNKGIKRKIND